MNKYKPFQLWRYVVLFILNVEKLMTERTTSVVGFRKIWLINKSHLLLIYDLVQE